MADRSWFAATDQQLMYGS
uniref:Uncharacterized protein n=1 Tax=Arundo donax TaxID=35708 RepID=A0A0A9FA90_ARUDO